MSDVFNGTSFALAKARADVCPGMLRRAAWRPFHARVSLGR